MSNAMTVPASGDESTAPKLQRVGEANAEACVGEFCELPAHREQAVINRRVDNDQI
jgi:hypothetical protein